MTRQNYCFPLFFRPKLRVIGMVKLMKLIVMFDLPTGTKEERRSYSLFRKYLIEEGFMMMQYSVYAKTCGGVPAAEALEARINCHLPKVGSVTSFLMTEKEFARRRILVSNYHPELEIEQPVQLTLFL